MAQTVNVSQDQVDAAVEEIGRIIEIGENGTRGDYTEVGALVHVLSALGIELRVTPRP
jgi:hypothetical protein